jgi:hypothetical protein
VAITDSQEVSSFCLNRWGRKAVEGTIGPHSLGALCPQQPGPDPYGHLPRGSKPLRRS